MPSLERINQQIAALENAGTFGTRKEIRYLPEILLDDEVIHAITSGIMDSNTWLIVCTNKRVLMLDKGFFFGLRQFEMPLAKINSIQQRTGFFFGEIYIGDGASQMVITNVFKSRVKPFVNGLNRAIEQLKSGGPAPAEASSTIAQLERLAQLKEKGVLTEEEFQAEKRKILSA